MSATPKSVKRRKTADPVDEDVRMLRACGIDVTDNEYRCLMRNMARANCSVCAKCGTGIAPGAPVWRVIVFLDEGPRCPGDRYTIAPVCKRCKLKSRFTFFLPPQPCEGCGRPVHNEDDGRRRARTVCCTACERVGRLAAARQRRSETRGTQQCEAEGCGEMFEPTRTDARFCSSRCRQRAYRGRKSVTDDDVGTQCPSPIIRNAPVTDHEASTQCPRPISRNRGSAA